MLGRVLDGPLSRAGGLVPGAVVVLPDLTALGLDDGDALTRPRDEQVDLPVTRVLDQRERPEEEHLLGQLVAQRLPYRPLALALEAGGKLGVGREAARREAFLSHTESLRGIRPLGAG